MIDPPWWACLPKIPDTPEAVEFRILMRVFADPTAPSSWGAYNPRSEQHQVVNFFENFRLDAGNVWISFLLRRLGLGRASVVHAQWSYEYADPDTSRLADLVIGYEDANGQGVIVIEAKKTSDCLGSGLSEKDDPTRSTYLEFGQISRMQRKVQMLLVPQCAIKNLPVHVRAGGMLITWEELAALQQHIFEVAAGEHRTLVARALRMHHAFLGIGSEHTPIVTSQLKPISSPQPDQWLRWLDGVERYARQRKQAPLNVTGEWFAGEPTRTALIAREGQTSKQRQERAWLAFASD